MRRVIEVRLNAATKPDRIRTAEFYTHPQVGWRSHSDTHGSALCRMCGRWVGAIRRHVDTELDGKTVRDLQPWSEALEGAIVSHLTICEVAAR